MWKRRISRIKIAINFKLIAKYTFSVLISLVILVFINVVYLKSLIEAQYLPKVYTEVSKVPEERVAIVFGAGLDEGGRSPSPILEDRVLAAVDLYKAGKISKIIMTGDNRIIEHNEPKIMIETAIKNGVKDFDLQPDYAGRRTYDSCYRAKAIFGVNKAILVSQSYHLSRALYICSSLGIDVVGYAADKHIYVDINSDVTREYLATFLAFWQLNVSPPSVVLGEKIPL
jgi:SanA protein